MWLPNFWKKKIVGEKRENGATNEREKVNSTFSTSQLLPIFSLPVIKNGVERKSGDRMREKL